jgi:hypothetical protein
MAWGQSKQMTEAHYTCPRKSGITFDSLIDVPNKTPSRRPIIRVSHGNHGIIEQAEISLTLDDEAGSGYEANCIQCLEKSNKQRYKPNAPIAS